MNLRIIFSQPWLLLLLIPAIALVILPHLKLSKRYRRTRNRIISLVLQVCIMVLSISVLAGTTFAYSETNYENELVILVDVSDSANAETTMNSKNNFIQDLLRESGGAYRTGIVKFANGYTYAAEMGYDASSLYRDYITSRNPDPGGTNIAGALEFAKTLIKKPKTAKIVILSDGLETDDEALAAVMPIILQGTKVDTVYFAGTEVDKEIQINSVKFPDHNILLDEEFTLNIEIESSFVGEATITIVDNGEKVVEEKVVLQKNANPYPFTIEFNNTGAHELRFFVESTLDKVKQNNSFCSYFYLEVVDRLLIIQRDDEATLLKDILGQEHILGQGNEFNNVVITNFGRSNCPESLEEMAEYDQIVLMNIANADMPEGFVGLLDKYVSEFGGGLLTIGGNKNISETDVPEYTNNTYDYQDMNGTDYAAMLPVEAVEKYTPPVAVLLVIDVSQSMSEPPSKGGSKNKMALAKEGAINSLQYLNDRDYIGVVSFSNVAKTISEIVPASRREEVKSKISLLSPEAGTFYSTGIAEAGNKLMAFTGARKKHIIFITDGEPGDWRDKDDIAAGYMSHIRKNKAAGITMSAIDISSDSSAKSALIEIGDVIGADNVHLGTDITKLSIKIQEILEVPDITSFMNIRFTPMVNETNKITKGIDYLPELKGYYGVAAKADSVVSVIGDYAPLYAHWNYGKGKVGSFMCDLDGTWSGEFLTEDSNGNYNGIKLVSNIIRELFPAQSIKYTEIKATFEINNFKPRIQVDNANGLPSGDYYEVVVKRVDDYYGSDSTKQVKRMNEAGKLFKCDYTVYESGVYLVDILRKNADGKIVDQINTFTIFSYSSEYNEFVNPILGENLLTELADRGGGNVITEPSAALEAVTEIPETYDPRIPFIITVIILFLLDVAVRKFKFKWPWEIIRDRKEKKRMAEIKARRNAGFKKQ